MPPSAARLLPRFRSSSWSRPAPRSRPSPAPDDHYYPELVDRYRRVRLFLPPLLRTVAFDGTQAGQPMLTALNFL